MRVLLWNILSPLTNKDAMTQKKWRVITKDFYIEIISFVGTLHSSVDIVKETQNSGNKRIS